MATTTAIPCGLHDTPAVLRAGHAGVAVRGERGRTARVVAHTSRCWRRASRCLSTPIQRPIAPVRLQACRPPGAPAWRRQVSEDAQGARRSARHGGMSRTTSRLLLQRLGQSARGLLAGWSRRRGGGRRARTRSGRTARSSRCWRPGRRRRCRRCGWRTYPTSWAWPRSRSTSARTAAWPARRGSTSACGRRAPGQQHEEVPNEVMARVKGV